MYQTVWLLALYFKTTISTQPTKSLYLMSNVNYDTIVDDAKFRDLAQEPTEAQAKQTAAAKVMYLAEGMNGPNTFDITKASYGYIEPHQRLSVPADLRDKIQANTLALSGLNMHYENGVAKESLPKSTIDIVDLLRITMANYARLTRGGINQEHAFFIATLRARLIQNGYLFVDQKERSVTINEVDWINNVPNEHKVLYDSNAEYKATYDTLNGTGDKLLHIIGHVPEGSFKKFFRYCMADKNVGIIQHIVLMADQYAAMLYLVFRQHGHHWTKDYEQKYNIMFKATTLDSHPSYPGHELVMRVAMHSFGIKCFHQKFWELLECQKLAETFVDRSDVAPSGTAVVATCAAAFRSLMGVPVWDSLYVAYKPQIDSLFKTADGLKGKNAKSAVKFHKNARLFGVDRMHIDTVHAEALAAVAKGYIMALGDTSDLNRQKALDKRAAQNPLMVQVMTSVILKIADRLSNQEDALQIISSRALASGNSSGEGTPRIEDAD